MAVDRSGTWWKGSDPHDIDEYLAEFSANGYPVETIRHSVCSACGSREFAFRVDDDEGCAERTCHVCATSTSMLDSAEHVDDAELETAACPCGAAVFNVAVGFARYPESDDIRWGVPGTALHPPWALSRGGAKAVRGALRCRFDWRRPQALVDPRGNL